MAINKVVYGNDTLIDLTDTTATASDVASGKSFYGANGVLTTGSGDYVDDVQVNGNSVVSDHVANIVTESAYNSSTNKIATKSDIPTKTSELTNNSGFITKSVNNLNNYELKTDTGHSIELSLNTTTYVMTLNLKNSAGTTISTDTIDLPLESVVVNGSYDSTNKKIILTLESGSTIDIPVGDLVSGLQSEITSSNKLSSDLVDDTNKTHKFVTSSEKTTWNGKQNAITSTNKLDYSLLSNTPTIPTVNNATLTIQKNGSTVNTFTANASSNVTANITVPTKTSQLTNDSGYTTNTGTITKVQANGTDVASSGTANIPAATTSSYGVTQLSNSTSSTSTSLAATPSAVKSAYDLANTANTTSGTNSINIGDLTALTTTDKSDLVSAINEIITKLNDLDGKKVWTNSNPTNTFAGQTITLSESLNNYNYYEIVFRQNITSSRYFSTGKIPVDYGTILEAYGNTYRATGTTVSGNTIYFESATPDNNYAIPIYVKGYK